MTTIDLSQVLVDDTVSLLAILGFMEIAQRLRQG
jgi:hypothetical protein